MSPHSDAGELAGKTALAAVAAAIACCGIPLLIAAGLTGAGHEDANTTNESFDREER